MSSPNVGILCHGHTGARDRDRLHPLGAQDSSAVCGADSGGCLGLRPCGCSRCTDHRLDLVSAVGRHGWWPLLAPRCSLVPRLDLDFLCGLRHLQPRWRGAGESLAPLLGGPTGAFGAGWRSDGLQVVLRSCVLRRKWSCDVASFASVAVDGRRYECTDLLHHLAACSLLCSWARSIRGAPHITWSARSVALHWLGLPQLLSFRTSQNHRGALSAAFRCLCDRCSDLAAHSSVSCLADGRLSMLPPAAGGQRLRRLRTRVGCAAVAMLLPRLCRRSRSLRARSAPTLQCPANAGRCFRDVLHRHALAVGCAGRLARKGGRRGVLRCCSGPFGGWAGPASEQRASCWHARGWQWHRVGRRALCM
mmetsp:Transcript_3558/g.13006  ORF Transcript_3558/g.13006 Transcript_3558/m.13006 type:complete len:363 (-) Transcript_3558:1054-2142(-)